jgi:hypothetical protein
MNETFLTFWEGRIVYSKTDSDLRGLPECAAQCSARHIEVASEKQILSSWEFAADPVSGITEAPSRPSVA